MTKILIDCRFGAEHAGLGRYTREIAKALVSLQTEHRIQLLVRSKNDGWLPSMKSSVELVEAPVPHYSLREQTELPRIIKQSGADSLFSPHFNVPLRCPIPFVVTIHDLILHRYPNNASLVKQIAYRAIMNHAVTHAKHIISVSTFVKNEIESTYASKTLPSISVIREGVDEHYKPAAKVERQFIREKFKVSNDFFLYVGNAKQHKNVQLLLDAFSASQLHNVELLLVSSGKEVSDLSLPSNVRVINNVTDEDLIALYSEAKAFVTASLYEGYCLPIPEALACGTPVIATNVSAIPETAAGHAVLLEPTVEAFMQAFQNPPQKINPVILGSWSEAAKKTLQLLS